MILSSYVLDEALNPEISIELSGISLSEQALSGSINAAKRLLGERYSLLDGIEYSTPNAAYTLGFKIPEAPDYYLVVLSDGITNPLPLLNRYAAIISGFVSEEGRVNEWGEGTKEFITRATRPLIRLFDGISQGQASRTNYELEGVYLIAGSTLPVLSKEFRRVFGTARVVTTDYSEDEFVRDTLPALIRTLSYQAGSAIPDSKLTRIMIRPDIELSVDDVSDDFTLLMIYKGDRRAHERFKNELLQALEPLKGLSWDGDVSGVRERAGAFTTLLEGLERTFLSE